MRANPTERRITLHLLVESVALTFDRAFLWCCGLSRELRIAGSIPVWRVIVVLLNNVQLQCSIYWLLLRLALNHIDFQTYFRTGDRARALSLSEKMKQSLLSTKTTKLQNKKSSCIEHTKDRQFCFLFCCDGRGKVTGALKSKANSIAICLWNRGNCVPSWYFGVGTAQE